MFFQCPFAAAVWRKVLVYLGEYHDPQNWIAEARWIASKGLGKGFKGRLRRLCITTMVYHVWRVRNDVVFNKGIMEIGHVVATCIHNIKSKVDSWRNIKRNRTNYKTCIE
ncbi:hypothetical protein LIER_15957 [Lithospermum erythrorhizon]|uniref:Uncharacterized protein n=1 Tax=Lithospermum erythrorhizon TaxID=34254 RepID=A0AAV3Q6E7_LITER